MKAEPGVANLIVRWERLTEGNSKQGRNTFSLDEFQGGDGDD